MLYIVAMVTSFAAISDAERAIAAASAAAWPSGKRSLPSTKVGLCHTKPSFIGGGRGYNVAISCPVLGSLGKGVIAAVLRFTPGPVVSMDESQLLPSDGSGHITNALGPRIEV